MWNKEAIHRSLNLFVHPLFQNAKAFEDQKLDLSGYLSGLLAGESKAHHHESEIFVLSDFGGPCYVHHQE